MVEYESIMILKPNMNPKDLNLIVTNIGDKIKEYGEITKQEDLGIKKLAYEVRKNKEGRYYIFQFKMNENKHQDGIKELERLYRILDEVIKFLTIRKEN